MNNQNMWNAGASVKNLLLAFGLAAVSVVSLAQTAIEAVSGSVQGGAEVIRIDLSQPLTAIPTGFSIQSPARERGPGR